MSMRALVSTTLKRWLPAVAMCLTLGTSPLFGSSDAELMRRTIDVATVLGIEKPAAKTLYRSKQDPDQFYYLPSNLRFMQDAQGRPMFTVYKYNLVYNNGNFISPEEEKAGEVYQGGTLKATFTMGLEQREIEQLRDGLVRAGFRNAKVGRFPITDATFTLTLTDPENPKSQMVLGPFVAPVHDDVLAVQSPISKAAADIFKAVLTEPSGPDAPINVYFSFTYGGYGLDNSVTVKGEWENVYKSTQTKMSVSGSYWFFSVNASYEKLKQELIQDANISIEFDGDVPQEMKDRANGEIMDVVLKQAFDLSTLKPMPGDDLNDSAGTAKGPDGQKIKGKSASLGVGFAKKVISRERKGKINIRQALLTRISQESAVYGTLSLSNIDPQLNYKEINASDWSVARVQATISRDVFPWFVVKKPDGTVLPQIVALTYGSEVSTQTFPRSIVPGGEATDFGVFPNNGTPHVSISWPLNFAPWPQIQKEFGVTQQMAAASYGEVQRAMQRFYSGPRGASYEAEGDLRLMSGINLTATSLPLVPERVTFLPTVIGPEDTGINWYGPGNQMVLMIEQDYEDRNGQTHTIRVPLGKVEMKLGSVAAPFEPLEAFILSGPNAGEPRLVAQAIVLAKEAGGRLVKTNVTLPVVPKSGSPVILLDEYLGEAS